jgi:hypothetical protein
MGKTEIIKTTSMTPGEYAGALVAIAPVACAFIGSLTLVGFVSAQAGHALYEAGQFNEETALEKQAKEIAREILDS